MTKQRVLIDLTLLRADTERVISDCTRVLAGDNTAVMDEARDVIAHERARLVAFEQLEALAMTVAGALPVEPSLLQHMTNLCDCCESRANCLWDEVERLRAALRQIAAIEGYDPSQKIAEAALATQAEPSADLSINKMMVGPHQALDMPTDNGRVSVSNGSPHLVEVIARRVKPPLQKYQSPPAIIDGPCIHCHQPFAAHWQDEKTYLYMCALNRGGDA